MKLSKLATVTINGNQTVRQFIMDHYGISRQTLHTWRMFNDPRLCEDKIVRFIAKYLEVDADLVWHE